MGSRYFEERRAAGKMTTYETKYTEDELGNKKQVSFELKASGNTPYHTLMGYPATADHGSYYEFDWLPPSDYPECYLLASESIWLKSN